MRGWLGSRKSIKKEIRILACRLRDDDDHPVVDVHVRGIRGYHANVRAADFEKRIQMLIVATTQFLDEVDCNWPPTGDAGSYCRDGCNGLPHPLGRFIDLAVPEMRITRSHAGVGMTDQTGDHRNRLRNESINDNTPPEHRIGFGFSARW